MLLGSLRELQQYATDLQRVTMFGDETTMDAMSKLLSFSSIQGRYLKKLLPPLKIWLPYSRPTFNRLFCNWEKHLKIQIWA